MSEAILIWVYLSLGNFVTIWTVFLIFLILGGGVTAFIICAIEDSLEPLTNFIDKVKPYLPIKTMVVMTLISIAYPSKEDLKYIIGGALVVNGAQAASEIEGIEKLPKNLVNAMNVFLEKSVEENDL